MNGRKEQAWAGDSGDSACSELGLNTGSPQGTLEGYQAHGICFYWGWSGKTRFQVIFIQMSHSKLKGDIQAAHFPHLLGNKVPFSVTSWEMWGPRGLGIKLGCSDRQSWSCCRFVAVSWSRAGVGWDQSFFVMDVGTGETERHSITKKLY